LLASLPAALPLLALLHLVLVTRRSMTQLLGFLNSAGTWFRSCGLPWKKYTRQGGFLPNSSSIGGNALPQEVLALVLIIDKKPLLPLHCVAGQVQKAKQFYLFPLISDVGGGVTANANANANATANANANATAICTVRKRKWSFPFLSLFVEQENERDNETPISLFITHISMLLRTQVHLHQQ
jgi:hypothetical protein